MNNNKSKDDKSHTYSEAIELAGNGCYNISLFLILSMSLLAMCIDLFSFSVIIPYSGCDFHLTITQKSILVSIPFAGPVLMAYGWGYICDTQGRKKSLFIAMCCSFVACSLGAFAPNFYVLGALKFISTCCCSCAQSATCTLLGESCAERVKGTYLLIMTSIVHLGSTTIYTAAYFLGVADFSYNLGYITFVPWRLLILLMSLPLGLSAIGLLFVYESPKFLLNAGRADEALDILKNICRRNGGDADNYPVHKIVLDEVGNVTRKDVSLLQSMWEQIAPLFKPPLLFNTMLLYYLIFVVYSTNSGAYVWLPFIAKAFVPRTDGVDTESGGLCNIISHTVVNNTTPSETTTCTSPIDKTVLIAIIIYGCSAATLNGLLSRLASRKKLLMISIISFSGFSCLFTVAIAKDIANFFYFGIFVSSMTMGPTSAYYVDLYPTSFRGMAACLGVMMARISSIIGVNLVGPYLMNSCNVTFYVMASFILSGAVMGFLLPPDRPKKVLNT